MRGQTANLGLMGACYALGTFADNLYKQAAVLMAAAAAMTDVQSWATVLFSLPFVLFSAWAGWLADRAAKKHVVVASKALELCAMLAGAWMLLAMNWGGILAVVFLMATQSTLFSPAINGSIPEHFASQEVPRANAFIKAASTLAILAGMGLAGFLLDSSPDCLTNAWFMPGQDQAAPGRAAVGLFLVAVSALGLCLSLFLQVKKATGSEAPFPWAGPLHSLKQAFEVKKDPALFLTLMADCWFYGLAVIAVISIANLTLALGYSNSAAGAFSALLMIGVALGSLVAGRRGPESWRLLLLPSSLGMALALCLCGLTPLVPESAFLRPLFFGLSLLACGLCGGIYLIPLESFIQVRPAPGEKGKIIALSNFMSFTAMSLFGAAFYLIGLLPPALTFPVYGLGTLLFALCFAAPRLRKLPEATLQDASPLGLPLRTVLSLRYRIKAEGFERIAARRPGLTGTLYLANHPSLLDPLICWSFLTGVRARPLADTAQMAGPLQSLAGLITGAVTIPDIARDGKSSATAVRLALEECAAALHRGENILLFPSGRASRDGTERLGSNSAVFRLLQSAPGTRLVLLRLSGLWGSSFSYAFGNKPFFMRALRQGLVTLLGNGLFFSPRRSVHVEALELAPPSGLNKLDLNRSLEAHFDAAGKEAVRIRRFFWQKNC